MPDSGTGKINTDFESVHRQVYDICLFLLQTKRRDRTMNVIICRDGKVADISGKEPLISEGMPELKRTFVVRMIAQERLGKRCIAEEIFENEPTENQIRWCLLKHTAADFAVVVEIYTIDREEIDLPFR